MPAPVRAAAAAALGGASFHKELAWMSWAGIVWRLDGESGSVYVKRASELASERDRLLWLQGRIPVPEVISLFHAWGDDWLVTHALAGRPLSDPKLGWEPTRVARRMGEVLQDIHSIDATGCPFGRAKPGNVFIHGDFCLPNVLVHDGRVSGLVDVGRAGLGDPLDDLAAGVWSLQYNFGPGLGPGLAREFLDAYGAEPMTDRAVERLRRRYGR
jgi:aminoglycoside phosphotransferase